MDLKKLEEYLILLQKYNVSEFSMDNLTLKLDKIYVEYPEKEESTDDNFEDEDYTYAATGFKFDFSKKEDSE